MDYNTSQIAICTSDHKKCALFFENIYPICLVSKELQDLAIQVYNQSLTDTDRINITKKYFTGLKFEEANEVSFMFAKEMLSEVHKGKKDISYFNKIRQIGFSGSAPSLYEIDNLANLIRKKFLKNGLCAATVGNSYFGVEDINQSHQADIIEIVLEGASIVDPVNLEWEQIFEIRSDSEAKTKLQRYRLFLFDNYIGKPKSYIKESLEKKVDDYRNVCKKHGVDLVVGTIGVLLDSKSLLASMTMVTAGVLFNEPFLANLGILTGSGVEICKMSLKFAELTRAIKSYKDNHELAYLMLLKEKSSTVPNMANSADAKKQRG